MKITNPTEKDEMFAWKIIEERIAREGEREALQRERERADRYKQNLTSYVEQVGKLKTENVSQNFHLFRRTTV